MASPFPDTSRDGMPESVRAWLTELMQSPRTVPSRLFLDSLDEDAPAPPGYTFNGRGDLINLTKRQRRATE